MSPSWCNYSGLGRSRRSAEARPLSVAAKAALNLKLRRRITQDVPFGMALEGLTAAELAYENAGSSA